MSLSGKFDEALVYAHELHRRQQRKGDGTPYIAHLLAVAGLVLEAGGSETEAIAALLHDAVEDQGGPAVAEAITRRFGREVAEIVVHCSDWDGIGEKPAWRPRKQAYIESLAAVSRSALLVISADKLHNVRTLRTSYREQGAALWSRFGGGRDGVLWYYRSVAAALRAAGAPANFVDEIDQAVDLLEEQIAAGT